MKVPPWTTRHAARTRSIAIYVSVHRCARALSMIQSRLRRWKILWSNIPAGCFATLPRPWRKILSTSWFMETVGQRANELLTELKIYVFVIRGLSQLRDHDRNLLDDPKLRVDRSFRLTVEFETAITFGFPFSRGSQKSFQRWTKNSKIARRILCW